MTIANLLLVDDETGFLEAMKRRLTKREFAVETAESGAAALALIAEKPDTIEVIVLDVKMPGMDGVETLEEIKRKFPLIEVIMLTGHATVESAIDGMKKGAFDYLMKPCEIDILVEKATKAAAKKREHEQKIIEARVKEITGRRT